MHGVATTNASTMTRTIAPMRFAERSSSFSRARATTNARASRGGDEGGGKRVTKASEELAEKFSHTTQLLNALAVYHMLAGKYEEAQRLLNEALGKNANDPDTLANLVACLPHVGQSSDLVKRYETQLTSVAPHHGWVANITAVSV